MLSSQLRSNRRFLQQDMFGTDPLNLSKRTRTIPSLATLLELSPSTLPPMTVDMVFSGTSGTQVAVEDFDEENMEGME